MATANSQPFVNQNQDQHQNQTMSTTDTNECNILFLVWHIQKIFRSDSKSSDELHKLFITLARCIDYALSKDEIPKLPLDVLPSFLREVCQHSNEVTLQPAISLLMIAVKNACRNRWFSSRDCDELLKISNELLKNCCLINSITSDETNALNIISELIPRFYPQLKLGRVLLTFEVKPGFEAMMSDFLIERSTTRKDSIRLLVAQTNDLKPSSCLINPPQISFMLNGKAVSGRSNVFQDKGPQLPTDVTRMLKYGTNIIQTVGYSCGNYLVALAFMSKNSHIPRPKLQEYVEPSTNALDQDTEVFEGPSKVSLNCPISLKRIRRPVKGNLCKHLQCFDYDNFVEINCVKPSWRCPFCNQPTSFMDLRIDQNLAKILAEVSVDATHVIISSDGSYKPIFNKDKSQDQDEATNSEFTVNPETIAFDLTNDENGESMDTDLENYETKPFEMCQNLSNSESLNQQRTSVHASIQNTGTLESLVSGIVLNPTTTNYSIQNTRRSLPSNIGRVLVPTHAHQTNSQSVYSSHHLNGRFFSQNQSGMQQANSTWPWQQQTQLIQPTNQSYSNTTSIPGIYTRNPCHTNTTYTTNPQPFLPASSLLPGETTFDHYNRILASQRFNSQNWQPLETMRGSLVGNSYDVQRNQYLNSIAADANGDGFLNLMNQDNLTGGI